MPFNLPANFDLNRISEFLQKCSFLPVVLSEEKASPTAPEIIASLTEAVDKAPQEITEELLQEIQKLLNSLEMELNKEEHNRDEAFEKARKFLNQLSEEINTKAVVAESLETPTELCPAMARDQKLVKKLSRAVPTGETKAKDVDLDNYDPSDYAGRQSMIAMLKFAKELLNSHQETIQESFEIICSEMLANSRFAGDSLKDTIDSFLLVLTEPALSGLTQLTVCHDALKALKTSDNPQDVRTAAAKILELMQSLTGQPELSDTLFKISSELSTWFLLNSASLDELLNEVITRKDVTVRELALAGACLGSLLEAEAFNFLKEITLEDDEENQYEILASYVRELLCSFNQVVQPKEVHYSLLLYLESMMQAFEIETGIKDDLEGYLISLGNLYAITGRVLLPQKHQDELSDSYFGDDDISDKARNLINLMLAQAEALPGLLKNLNKKKKPLVELFGVTYNYFFDFLSQLILALDALKSKALLNEYIPKFQACIKAFLTDTVLADDNIVRFREMIINKGIEAGLLLAFATGDFASFEVLLSRGKVSTAMAQDILLQKFLTQTKAGKDRPVRCKKADDNKDQENVLDAYVLMLSLLSELKKKPVPDSVLFSAPAADYFAQMMSAMVGMKDIPLKIRSEVGGKYQPLLHAEMCANAAEFMCRLMKKLGDVEKEERYALECAFYRYLEWFAKQAEKQSKFRDAIAINPDLAGRIQLPSGPSEIPGSENPFVLSLSEKFDSNKPTVPFLKLPQFDMLFFRFQREPSSETLKAGFKISYYKAVIQKMRTLHPYAHPLMPEDLKEAIVCLEKSLMSYVFSSTANGSSLVCLDERLMSGVFSTMPNGSRTSSVHAFLTNHDCESIVFDVKILQEKVGNVSTVEGFLAVFNDALKNDFPEPEARGVRGFLDGILVKVHHARGEEYTYVPHPPKQPGVPLGASSTGFKLSNS